MCLLESILTIIGKNVFLKGLSILIIWKWVSSYQLIICTADSSDCGANSQGGGANSCPCGANSYHGGANGKITFLAELIPLPFLRT